MESPYTFRARTLAQGISTQASVMRPENQVDDAENITFSIIDGAVKRPGSSVVAVLDSVPANGRSYGIHRIERDDEEQYLIVYGRGLFEVVNIKTGRRGSLSMKATSTNYLAIGSPKREDFRFLTIGDTTFVLNRKVSTGMERGWRFDAAVMPHSLKRISVSPLAFEMTQTPWTERNFKEQVLGGTATRGEFRIAYRGSSSQVYVPTTPDEDAPIIPFLQYHHIRWDAPASHFTESTEGDGVQQFLAELNSITRGKVLCTGGPLPDKDIVIEISEDLVPGDGATELNSNG